MLVYRRARQQSPGLVLLPKRMTSALLLDRPSFLAGVLYPRGKTPRPPAAASESLGHQSPRKLRNQPQHQAQRSWLEHRLEHSAPAQVRHQVPLLLQGPGQPPSLRTSLMRPAQSATYRKAMQPALSC